MPPTVVAHNEPTIFSDGCWAYKRSGTGLVWQRRHFVINPHSHSLIYCKDLDAQSLEGGILDMNEVKNGSS